MPESLLCVFAHPDDESLACGGLMARCADSGVDVSALCLTRGEHGPRGGPLPPDAAPFEVGACRSDELRTACRVLGVSRVMLLDHEDGMLPWIPPAILEGDIAQVIAAIRPDVVVTFDADGLYWHPDHVAVHERTTSVVREMGDEGPALYYATLPEGSIRGIVDAARSRLGPDGDRALEVIPGISTDAFAAAFEVPTHVLDVRDQAARKLQALRCHASQTGGTAFALLEPPDAPRLLGREQYRRAGAGRPGLTFLDAWTSRLDERSLR